VLKHAELYMYYRKNEEHEQFDKGLISNIKNSMLLDSPITEEQVSRIKELATKTGACMQLPNSVIEKLGLLAEMHDIGNIAIKSETLLKSGELSEDERMDVKMHPEIGYRISHITNELSSISELILTHHEQWDGGGYPSGLSGNDMPLLSRILAVADSYVAMTSDRPHRKAMSKEKAIAEIKSLAGKKYDAKVVDIFINSVLTSETVN
jgi:HD-GYP domain-containing protein (c-di-GMP phosphodiesterase class II)